MKDYYVDAVKTATSIHKGDFSFLHGKEFKVRDKMKKKKGRVHPGVKTVKTSRLDRIEESITKLAEEMRAGFKQVNTRIDNLEKDINARLDYIVEVNNLKDIK